MSNLNNVIGSAKWGYVIATPTSKAATPKQPTSVPVAYLEARIALLTERAAVSRLDDRANIEREITALRKRLSKAVSR